MRTVLYGLIFGFAAWYAYGTYVAVCQSIAPIVARF